MIRFIAVGITVLLMTACGLPGDYRVANEAMLKAPPPPLAIVAAMPRPAAAANKVMLFSRDDAERYAPIKEHGITAVAEQPISTFSADVDTASYANVRQTLLADRWPTKDAVRVEEFINYFDYQQTPPASRDTPFAVDVETAPTPWNLKTHLIKIGLKGYTLQPAEIPPSNLVFLIDVSGSMDGADRLGLLKQSMGELVGQLRPQDRISLVVYSGRTATLFEGEPGTEKSRIR